MISLLDLNPTCAESKNTVPRTKTLSRPRSRNKSVSVFIKFQSATGSQKMNIENPLLINRVYAHTKINGWAKYEQDPWNIVGCRVVTRAGRTNGGTDRWTNVQTVQGTTIPHGLNGLRVTMETYENFLDTEKSQIVAILTDKGEKNILKYDGCWWSWSGEGARTSAVKVLIKFSQNILGPDSI